MVFDAPYGLHAYDCSVHDFVEPDGTLTAPAKVAAAFEMNTEQVVADREARQDRQNQMKQE